MENLIAVLEEFLAQLDGDNIRPVTEDNSMYSSVEFVVQGFDYRRNSAQIQNFSVEEYNPDDEFVEFALNIKCNLDILFEGDDFSEATHDPEDDEWYNVTTVSIEHTYEVSFDLQVRLNLTNEIFEIISPIREIAIDVDVDEFIEE